ncbi:fibrocystin-L-like [Ptychodera flava]|uniref:fibrocystin-L-like n=1 Tax=Ptychodera flava TaxID=63121 RepID=UPI00396AA0A7
MSRTIWTSIVLQLLCHLQTVTFAADAVYKVDSLSPSSGSIRGATVLTIRGSGFTKDSLQYGKDYTVGNEVFLRTATTSVICDVILYDTNEKQIVCTTQRAPAGLYTVFIKVNGDTIEDYCDRASDCQFEYKTDVSPTITAVTPKSGLPGTLLNVQGKIITDQYIVTKDDYDEDEEDIPSETISRVYLGNQECSLVDEDSELYGISLTSGQNGNLYCMPAGTFIASQNISFIINNNGRSWVLPSALHVSAQNKLYLYQTHAEITDVYPQSGSVEGGTYLTITGRHFDTDVEVLVGGVPCKVDNVTQTEITCTTGEKPDDQSTYPGQRGLLREVWTTTRADSLDDVASYSSDADDYHSEVITESSSPSQSSFGESDQYSSRISGYFVAPYDSEYTFHIICDDKAALYFSMTEDKADKQMIVECPSHNSDWTAHKSSPIQLVGGNHYYIEVPHIEYTGHDNVAIGVSIEDTPFTSGQVGAATNEIQKISTSSATEKEVQQLTFECSGNASLSTSFSFLYDGITSDELTTSSSASEVEEALIKMLNVECQDLGTGMAAFNSGFEDEYNMETGTIIKDEEPYCGHGSLKNPSIVFQAEQTQSSTGTTYGAIRISRYGQVCLAYKGAMIGRLGLQIQYTDDDGNEGVRGRNYNFDVVNNGQWQHTCIDVETMVENDGVMQSLGSDFKFWRIALSGELEEDFYIDNLFIGTDIANYLRSSRAARPNGLFITGVKVDEIDGGWEIAMSAENCGFDYPLLGIQGMDIAAGSPDPDSDYVSYLNDTGDFTCIFTVDRLTSATPPLTGNLLIELDNMTTNFAVDSTVQDVEDLFSTYFDYSVSVERSGTCSGYDWTIDFSGTGGNHPEMVILSSSLTVQNSNMSIETLQDGGLFLGPIQSDMLRTPHDLPQVTVKVNKVPTTCSNTSCDFEYSSANTPSVTSVSPTSGLSVSVQHRVSSLTLYVTHCQVHKTNSPTYGQFSDLVHIVKFTSVSPTSGTSSTRITISGSQFSTSASDNYVTIGGVECSMVSSSATEIQCDTGDASGGTQDISVVVDSVGLASHPSGTVQYQYSVEISDVSPSSGSTGGGLEITIAGSGFSNSSDDLTVELDGSECEIVSASFDTIVCLTPAASAGTVDVSVTINGVSDTSAAAFEYDSSLSPSISALSQAESGVTGGDVLTISGSGFGSSESSEDAILIGNEPCNITSYSDSSVECILPAQSPGTYSVKLYVSGKGYADASSVSTIEYNLKVTSISPTRGSQQGGTLVTITGKGFSDVLEENVVTFGDVGCTVTSSSDTELECVTGSIGVTHNVDNSGLHPSYGLGYKWNPPQVVAKTGDTVLWEWAVPGYVEGIGYAVQQTADASSTVYDGSGFKSPGRIPVGSFSHTFYAAGTYYYSSGPVDEDGTLYMKGVINVEPADSVAKDLSVQLAGFEALHDTASGVSSSTSGACPGSDSSISSCSTSEPSGEDSDKFSFAFWDCSTPSVSEVTPNNGTSDTTLTIKGHGFSTTNCENEVTIDGHPCDVQSSSQDELTCTIDTEDALTVGEKHLLRVNVKNRGYALNSEGVFTMAPSIDSIWPTTGSVAGGTRMIISGDGFSADSVDDVDVVIGSNTVCDVASVNYTEIECITRPHAAWSDVVSLSINSAVSTCLGSYTYSYSNAASPVVSTISPTSISGASTTVTISGSGFSTTVENITVTFGSDDCSVQTLADDEITCDVGYVPVGDHAVVVNRADQGDAILSNGTVTSEAVIDSVSPSSGSINGGTVLTITGSGFHEDDTSVDIDGSDCDITSLTISEIVCTTAAHSAEAVDLTVTSGSIAYSAESYTYSNAQTPTVSSVSPGQGTSGDTITIGGTGFSGTTSDVEVTIDGVSCSVTSSSTTSIQCDVGVHSAGTFDVVVYIDSKGLATSSSTFEYQLEISSISPTECSFGGGRIVTIDGDGFDSDNTQVTICDNECVIDNVTATQVLCEAPANENLASGTQVCDVEVTISTSGSTTSSSDAFTYESSMTPIITSVSPTRGGTGGGTTVTITGTGFSSGENTVTIDGSVCEIDTESATEIVCTTGPNDRTIKTKVRVEVGDNGIATQDDADYFYVDVWSSRYTWGGYDPPVAGDFVIIPAGQTLVLDVDTPVLKMLLIEGGSVIFDDADVELKAENILIMDDGLLQVGTEEEPFQHKGIITMHGHVRSQELPMYGAKTLAVRHGTLDLHGIPVPVTWTHLATTAAAGANQITLMLSVTWQVGDEIVIATTNHRHSMIENEVVTITAVSDDGQTLTIEPPLEYEHISVLETLDGEVLETRAEVGLLTHNVVVRGSVQDEWTEVIEACEEEFDTNQFATQTCFQGRFGEEIGSDQFGSQIMLFAREQDQGLVTGRIEYVEVHHAGQAFRLGRYPIHFHLNGDVSGSYVRGCGIHDTFNRAVTIHAVHNLLVEHNVAYNIMGHAYFLEDGNETNNTIQYNLGVFVKASSSLLNVDVTPATFWVTNPDNIIRHNAAAGGTHFGYWYNMPSHPGGPSFTTEICPRKIPVAEFYNNTAHSMGWYGLWVFPEYFPAEGGTCDSSTPAPAKFYSLTAWNCERGAEVIDSGPVQFYNFLMANNDQAGVEMVEVSGGWDDGPLVKDSVIIGHSSISSNASQACTVAGVKTPKTPHLTVDGVKFINFDLDRCTAIRGCAHCKPRQGGWATRFQNLEFVDAPNKVGFQWEHECIYEDLDGTLTGTADYLVTPDNSILPSAHCNSDDDAFSAGITGAVCDDNVKLHRFSFNEVSPSSLLYKNVWFTNQYGASNDVPYKKKRLTHAEGWMITLVDGDTYNMIFQDVDHVTNISYTGKFYNFEDEDFLLINHNLTQKPDVFAITGEITNSTEEMVTYDDNENGEYYFDNATRHLTYLISGKGVSSPTDRGVHLEVFRCYYKDCIKPVPPPPPAGRPDDAVKWSDDASWAGVESGWGGNYGNGVYGPPRDGDDVQILPDLWMVADVALPNMNKLYIYGTLEIDDERNNVINATYIFIHGGRLVAGWSEDNPFSHKLHILLRGNHFTPDIPLPNGPNMGSKVLGVFGGLDLHGEPHNVYWTRLSATGNIGDDRITLEDSVDWKKGDEIVIAATDYEPFHTEIFTIKNVIDSNTLELNGSLAYTHLSASHTLSDNSYTYTMAAEVGLLTRNIIIEGEDYADLYEESFGGRVLVGNFRQNGEDFIGYARIANVEFKRCGQEGWPDFYDPRYSLAFLDTGLVTQSQPSYIKGNSFHSGFNTGIGVFGANGILVQDNVIHHTVGPGIIIYDDNHRLERNLVTLTVFPGTYQDRFESENLVWMGGIEVNKAKNVVLKNNTVAGSERVGFRISGEPCFSDIDPEDKWEGNVAHTTLHGVHMFYSDGLQGCSKISNFMVYKSYDFGVWFHPECSVMMSDLVLVDNTCGIMPMIYNPPALSHVTSDKFVSLSNSLIVGTVQAMIVTQTGVEVPQSSSDNKLQSLGKRAPRTPSKGKTGLIWPNFSSGPGGAPTKPFHKVTSYPAINGVAYITDVTFAHFGDHCNGKIDKAFMTNPSNGDAHHPIVAEGINFVDVDDGCEVFIHRPNLGFVNPADCVDMDCDAKKKSMIIDKDGGILGSEGTIIPMSEYEWDGDPRRGLGDYRIPKMMLTNPDGSRIPVEDKAPNKGIIRNNQCTWNDDWQAYKCHGLDHMMMIIESMDADTETRRLSPIALLADEYVDLINGPMDHGWCHGYTCQERISTFYTLVATGKEYEMYFTGTNPQSLRLHLLNSEYSQALIVGIWYATPQRLDIYRNGIYIAPTNAELSGTSFSWKAKDPNLPDDQFMPPMDSEVSGLNYFDKELQTLYILIRGADPIDIRTTPVVIVSFDMEPVHVDDFFEENLVANLAGLLGIDEDQIRVMEVVSESSRRRRRAVDSTSVTVEIGDPPQPTIEAPETVTTINDTETATPVPTTPPGNYTGLNQSLSFSQLEEVASFLVDQGQTGGLDDDLGLTILSMSVTDPIDTPVDPTGGVRATNETGGATNGTLYGETQDEEETEGDSVVYKIIKKLNVHTQLSGAYEGVPFLGQPVIDALDGYEEHVDNVGHSSSPWEVTVTLREVSGNANAVLIGNTTAQFTGGFANFTDLGISHTGEYILDFEVTKPENLTFQASSSSITVEIRPYSLSVVSSPSSAYVGEVFTTQPLVEIIDDTTGEAAEDIGMKGHTWQANVSFAMASIYLGKLHGNTTIPVNNSQVEFHDLYIDYKGKDHIIQVTVVSDPDDYELTILLPAFDVTVPNEEDPTGISKNVILEYDADYSSVIDGQESYFAIMFVNQMESIYTNVSVSNVLLSEGSILVAFDVTGPSSDVDSTLVTMWEDVKKGMSLSFNGYTIVAMETMKVDGEDYYGNDPQPLSTSLPMGAILGIVFAFIAVAIICVIGFLWWKKNKTRVEKIKSSFDSFDKLELHRYSPHKTRVHDESILPHETHDTIPLSAKILHEEDTDHESGIGMATPEQLRARVLPALHVNGGEFEFTRDDMKELNVGSRPGSADSLRSGNNTPVRAPTVEVEPLPPGVNSPTGNRETEVDIEQFMTVISMNSDRSFRRFGSLEVSMTGSMDKLRKEMVKQMPRKLNGKPFIFMRETLVDVETIREKKMVVSEVYGGDCIMIRFLPDSVIPRFFCFCGAVAHVECTLCGNQTYCGPKCQSADWPRHMQVCLKADNAMLKP